SPKRGSADVASVGLASAGHPLLGAAVSLADAKGRQRLLSLSEADRNRAVLDLVRAEAATVLGQNAPSAIAPDRPLGELGLDSHMALELRNRLSGVTGLRLPATLLFDYPTPNALMAFLIKAQIPERPQASAESGL